MMKLGSLHICVDSDVEEVGTRYFWSSEERELENL